MLHPNYLSALRSAERVNWNLDAVLPPDGAFDFERDFLPETLAATHELAFFSATERRLLNQIRAHGYLAMFGLVEEFILPYVLDRVTARAQADLHEVRALLGFAAEEAKHIELFRRFGEAFERGFGHACGTLGPPAALREHVLGHSELGVGLLILHIEWMTQQHYVEMVRGDEELESSFRRLLHQHWLEESQHARIDGWIVESLASTCAPEARALAFEEYRALLAFFDAGLGTQVELDLDAWQRASGRVLSEGERARFIESQLAAQRRTYLGAGVRHPRVRGAIERMLPSAAPELANLTARYS